MTTILSAGLILTFAAIIFCLIKWGNVTCVGVTPVKTFTFIAILFTSGLDVGLIMFPLTEFAGYADLSVSPEYGFSNPLSIEFGFWGFLIWGFYFLTSFYFCVIEPRVKFFEIPPVKIINNIVIIGTCAFTGALLLINLPWYLPVIGDGESIVWQFYLIVFVTICAAVYSSTSLKFVRILSLASTWLFLGLIALIAIIVGMGKSEWLQSINLLGNYFANIDKFALPINAYHEFYLFWWFAWSIMIGQFTARFVGGLKTWQVFASLLVFPSIPLAIWFAVLYQFHLKGIPTTEFISITMVVVGITFVINSLDSLIRLYSDNLNMTPKRLGTVPYVIGNVIIMSALVMLFKINWLQIQWVGALVIGIYFSCVIYIFFIKRKEVCAIKSSPEDNLLDFQKVKDID
ncbi:MAG: BCCT family transporter [Gammaproteobacteria bacterium]|nr:BCCT family transporter [Gammaproteobacteria bacterium]